MQIGYPLRIDARGRTAESLDAPHLRDLIEQVLFTIPGERVNRPDFGTGIQQLIFAPNSAELAAASEFLVQSAVERWLGELIIVDEIEIETSDSSLQITIAYTRRQTQTQQVEQFFREV
ncbi:GPW/gp25 family protein [Alkalinema pantanalense CENA528]|uniref:GPW/gp25 family protein n=1 Tax=Alkalinema pantanalense TaxID=1620705 RepID=UPI003D6E404D